MAHSVLYLLWVATPFAFLQDPSAPPPPTGLAADVGLQEALGMARSSGLPHRILLADHIDTLIELKKYEREEDFKVGAMAVLRHSDFSKDLALGELYLRMLQQPVIDDVRDGFDAAHKIAIDGDRRDWPAEAVSALGKVPSGGKKTPPLAEPWLRSFGALRGEESLIVIMETNRTIDPAAKVVFAVDIMRLADRFNEMAYTVNVTGKQVRFFDLKGEEFKLHEEQAVELATGLNTLELSIPLKRFEEDLRSIAVRSYVLDLQAQGPSTRSPWIACPSGPIPDPTAMLIEFATRRELPLGNSLPAAIALQEGLLTSRSAPDVAAEIKKDAYAWLELALDISSRSEIQGGRPVDKQPLSAQLAWSCRHDSSTGINTIEEYRSVVVSPETLRDMRGYAERQSWLTRDAEGSLRKNLAAFIDKEFKMFDYPDSAARDQGKDFEDTRSDAYIVKGKDRLLSYRDVGINDRWKHFEGGFGLKGSPAQAMQFHRALHLAMGLPALRAEHRNAENDASYLISFDGKTRNWFPVGSPALKVIPKSTILLQWVKPWTRPERFALSPAQIELRPAGLVRGFLDTGFEELTTQRLETLLNKGIPDQMISNSVFAPLRMR